MPAHVALHDQLVAHGHLLSSRLGRLESECAHQDSLHASSGGARAASTALDPLMGAARGELAHIEATLHRMAVGSFGCCVHCCAGISDEHLAASPHTEPCDACEPRPGMGPVAEVSAQHVSILRLLAGIVELVDGFAADEDPSPCSAGRTGAALTLLADLESELARHFVLEERGGCLSAATAAAPHLASQAATLQAEHAGLRHAAAGLAEAARQAGHSHAQWRALRQRLAAFSAKRLAHEEAENEILARSWLDDEGGGG